jgi:hypothetical protein
MGGLGLREGHTCATSTPAIQPKLTLNPKINSRTTSVHNR